MGVHTEVLRALPHTAHGFVCVVKNITSYSFKIGSENAGVRVAQEPAIFTRSKRDRRTSSSHGDPETGIDGVIEPPPYQPHPLQTRTGKARLCV